MKKLLYVSLLTLFFVGCDDRLEDLNTDKRNPAEVDPSSLFTQGLRETFDMMVSTSVNENPLRLYAQQWAQTTYPDESQYNMAGRSIPFNFWINAYRDVLIDFQESKRLMQEQLEAGNSGVSDAVLQNRIAATNIMMNYVYHVMVDVFGNVPYSEALDPENLSPSYDDARTIYNSVIADLDASVASIDESAAGFPESQDPMYEGDMAQWVKFANSLKLRMGMRLADVDKPASVSVVNEALAAGVFESNDDNASLPYLGSSPNTNPVHQALVLSGRKDYVAANTIVDVMNDLDDPRRAVFFRENLGDDVFEGGVYGDANSYAAFTQIGEIFHTPDLPGTILSYAEVEFLKAEAAERGGYNVEGTAMEHYNEGIIASFEQWGLSETEAMTYIAQPEVNYLTASGDWRQKLGIQKWLALYNQGFEAWTTWRLFDFEGFNAPPGMDESDIPLRLIYPLQEAQLNGPRYTEAAQAIGGDEASTPIFWDVR